MSLTMYAHLEKTMNILHYNEYIFIVAVPGCGRSVLKSSGFSTFIVGGDEVTPRGKWPWQVDMI